MKVKVIGQLMIALLFFSGVLRIVSASPSSLSLGGGGVTVSLDFPYEAHPNSTITHNFTITAHTNLKLESFIFSTYALVNDTWQEIGDPTVIINSYFPENQTFPGGKEFQLPQGTNGTLRCEMTFQTNQTSDLLLCSFYTTHVSELTFSEMQLKYNEMLANYTTLQANYYSLMNEYNGLLANYMALQSEVSSLSSGLNSKISEYNSLKTSFGSLNSTLFSLEGNYTELQGNYTALEIIYNALNDAKTQLEADYNDLLSSSDNNSTADRVVMFILVMVVAGLIALIIYIRRRESEPYVIIRKETVALKQDNES
jgi:hypothetical protein